MPNNLSSIFADAGSILQQQFGELDDTGEELSSKAIVLLLDPDEIELPAILSPIRYEVSLDARGEERKTMRRDAKVLPSDLAEYEITALPIRCEVRIGEEKWTHDSSQTEWGTMFIKIGLMREQLSRLKTQERNGGAV